MNLTANQVRSELRAFIAVKFDGYQRDAAKGIGVSESFLCDVLAGRREPTGKILDYLKLKRVTTYQR